MRALVTGGAGFIGSHVVTQLLAAGHDVVVLDNLSSGYRQNLVPDAAFLEADIRDPHAVLRAARGIDVVFHLAASVGNKRAIEGPTSDATANVIGTINVLEAVRANGCRKVVYSSSAAIFGEPRTMPIAEDHVTHPVTPYGVSKLAGEAYARVYGELYGFESVALRYFNVYGTRQRFDAYGNVIPIFATRALRGESLVIFGDGLQTRDFVDARDVARANVAAASASVTGPVNVGSGVKTTINDLARTILKLAHRDGPIEHREPRPGDVRHSQADVRRLGTIPGYAASGTLEQGLGTYMEWLRRDLAT